MGQDAGVVGDQIPAVRAETAVDGDVFLTDPDGLRNESIADPLPGIILFFSLNRLRIFINDIGSAVRREETGGRAVGQKASLRRREGVFGSLFAFPPAAVVSNPASSR